MILNYIFKRSMIKNWCQLLLIVFALMPCSVKNMYFQDGGSLFSKSLNATKVVPASSSCFYTFSQSKEHISSQKKEDLFSIKWLSSKIDCTYLSNLIDKRELIVYQSNAPPFYILYNRLKVDVLLS